MSKKLDQATREMREARIHRDVLDRAEAAILARTARRPAFVRPLLLGASGLAALAVGVVVLTPARASAGEILRIAGNVDRGLRRVRFSIVKPEGFLDQAYEVYLQGGKRRFAFATGDLALYDGRALYRRDRDGVVTVERQKSAPIGEEGSARELLAINAGEGARLSVRRGATDRYTIDRSDADANRTGLHPHLVLDVDPATERPLALRARTTDGLEKLTTWDYPAPDPALFRPLKADYDLDAQRDAVLSGLRGKGRKATVGGKSVELLELWVDELGNASAIARADYAYPLDYGLKIDGVASRPPEKPPFSGQWVIERPSAFKGRAIQTFGLLRPVRAGRFHFPDRVDVQVPVCEGKKLLGYARFEDVRVHRAYQTYFLKPDGQPFWDENPRTQGTEAKAVEDSGRP